MGKTILVTGGGGYIGSHTILQLLNEGFDVIALDNYVNCRKGDGNIPESLERVQRLTKKPMAFYEVDVREEEALVAVFEKHKIDCVIHFAALKAVAESCSLPLKYYQNNITGSTVLLEVMIKQGVKRIIFSSSATVYGNPQYLPLDEAHPVGNCTNPYGKTKHFMEEIIKDVCQSDSDWNAVLLRYFNPVGAHPSGMIGEDPKDIPNNLMPYIAQVAVGRREKLFVYGNDYATKDGSGIRDYIHVMDLADGHVAALMRMFENPDDKGVKVYNLGTGMGNSVLDAVKAFKEASGKEIPYEIVGRRPGDIGSSYASCNLAESELGWTAKYNLKDMCKDMWEWQSRNPYGFQKIEGK